MFQCWDSQYVRQIHISTKKLRTHKIWLSLPAVAKIKAHSKKRCQVYILLEDRRMSKICVLSHEFYWTPPCFDWLKMPVCHYAYRWYSMQLVIYVWCLNISVSLINALWLSTCIILLFPLVVCLLYFPGLLCVNFNHDIQACWDSMLPVSIR